MFTLLCLLQLVPAKLHVGCHSSRHAWFPIVLEGGNLHVFSSSDLAAEEAQILSPSS